MKRQRQIIDISRRQLLRGIGGATLALPVLPSLLCRTAYAADPVFTRPPRLFWVTTEHGGAFEASMFPSTSLLTASQALYTDHTVKSGALVPTTSGSDNVLSPVLRAPSSALSAKLIAKMNVLWGLDVPFYIAHNTGLHLGNYARNDGNGGDGKAVQAFPRPTIDQIMAWSPSFYSNLSGIRERAMIMANRPVSWNYTDPSVTTSSIENVRGYSSSTDLFNKIFVPVTGGGPAPRAPIVDRVLANYNRLRQSNRRLSAADKQRLDDHVARIAELQRKLTVTVSGASCSSITTPTDNANKHNANTPEDAGKQLQLWNEVAAAAFMCGTSRIGVLAYGDTSRFISYGGDFHQEVAHQWQLADKQALLVQSYQRFFSSVFLDMARRLDAVEEAPGLTYLDHSLLVWTQESGMETHGSVSIPVVTFGSAAGRLKTGLLCDYRRIGNTASQFDPGAGGKQTLGLLYSQWLATVLQTMGVPPAEYERWGTKGYGYPFITKESWTPPFGKHYGDTSSRYFKDASTYLPFLKA
jgi:hypothetical protein